MIWMPWWHNCERNDNEVEVDEADYPNGRFARVYDPDGNPVERWEPK